MLINTGKSVQLTRLEASWQYHYAFGLLLCNSSLDIKHFNCPFTSHKKDMAYSPEIIEHAHILAFLFHSRLSLASQTFQPAQLVAYIKQSIC